MKDVSLYKKTTGKKIPKLILISRFEYIMYLEANTKQMEVLFHILITRSIIQPPTTSLWKAFGKHSYIGQFLIQADFCGGPGIK